MATPRRREPLVKALPISLRSLAPKAPAPCRPSLKAHRKNQRWADKACRKRNLGNEWNKTFAEPSHAKGICLQKIGIEAKQPNSTIHKCARVQHVKNGKKIAAFVPNHGFFNYIDENYP